MTVRYAEFGSISSGTLRPEDLLAAFSDELDYQLQRQTTRFPRKEYRKLIREANAFRIERLDHSDGRDEAGWILDELLEALQEFAPQYGSFGTHSGDGADFGFWLSDSFFDDFDGERVVDTSEVPRGYTGEILHVNDHGNATLYAAKRGKLTEIWGIV